MANLEYSANGPATSLKNATPNAAQSKKSLSIVEIMQQSMQEASQIAKPLGGELVAQDATQELPQDSPGTRRGLADKDGGTA